MRAVQIESFGGPEVLQVAELPDPVPAEGQVVARVRAAGINFADTHAVEDSYLAKQKLPLIPGGEVLVELPDGGRGLGLADAGGYAEKVAVDPRRLIGVPDGISDAPGAVLPGAGRQRLAPAAHQHPPGGGRVGGGARRRRWRRHHRGPAGQAVGRRSGDRHRVDAEPSASWPSTWAPTSRSTPAAEDLTAALIEANGGRRVDIVLEMTGGTGVRPEPGRAGPVRPAGLLRDGRPDAADAGRARPT